MTDPEKAGLPPSREPPSSTPPPSEPIPHGPRVRVLLLTVVLCAGALAVGVAWHGPLQSSFDRAYNAVTGKFPASAPAAGDKWWTCGMHRQVLLHAPGDCPICHMRLVPLESVEKEGELVIDPVILQSIGVRTSKVTKGTVTQLVRTIGAVEYDETRVRDVTTKVSGWIEKLHVDSVGRPVRTGEALFEMYSPELYAAQEEYLAALRNRGKVSPDLLPDADLVGAARKRLENLDVSAEQIKALETTGKSARTLTVGSPFSGTVTVKNAVEGMKLDAGALLYRIVDLSAVWVMVTVYEYQLPFVQVNQKAAMTLPYLSGRTFEGKVAYVYPYLNVESRQVKLRLEFPNPDGVLKPGMFANVELSGTLPGERTLAPREAVIDTGQRQVAFVSLGGGRFEPRQVRMGADARDGTVEIVEGLKSGEDVVTSGQFLLDSENNMRESVAKMIKGTLAAEQKPQAAATRASELKSLPPEVETRLLAVMRAAFQISDRLSRDTAEGIAAPALALADGVEALVKLDIPDDPHFWHKHMDTGRLIEQARQLAGQTKLDDARDSFADLNVELSRLLRSTGVPPGFGAEVQELHCPDYRPARGGSIWLQPAGEVRNPYYGSSMLGCTDRQATLPTTGK